MVTTDIFTANFNSDLTYPYSETQQRDPNSSVITTYDCNIKKQERILHKGCNPNPPKIGKKLNIWVKLFVRRYIHSLKASERNYFKFTYWRGTVSAPEIRADCALCRRWALVSVQLGRVMGDSLLRPWPRCRQRNTDSLSGSTSRICLPFLFHTLPFWQPLSPTGIKAIFVSI
jgi:hypothetical protein